MNFFWWKEGGGGGEVGRGIESWFAVLINPLITVELQLLCTMCIAYCQIA